MKVLIAVVLACCASLVLAQAVDSAPADLLERAESAYAGAVEISERDRAAGREAFVGVAAAYRALIDAGVNNAAVQRNLGNAYLASGELGEAVVAYRRAHRLDPHDGRIADALAAARERVRSSVAPGVRTRAEDALLWWRGVVPRAWLAGLGLVGWGMIWAALLVRTRLGRLGLLAGVVLAAVGLGAVASEWAIMGRASVVVIEDGVVARVGPSDAVYDAVFTEPVREGVEGVVIEEREGWVRVRLRSGQQAWLPGWSVGTI
ncbi:MAG: tetratricopeptide repeat protein [Planctomycetota bacterium]